MTADAQTIGRSVLRDVDAALDPVRRKHRDLQAFMASQLERLELSAGRLDERRQELADESQRLAAERAKLEEEWAHLDALLEAAQANAAEIRQEKERLDELSREHPDNLQARELKRLRAEVDQLTHERRVVESELEAAQRKIAQWADVAVELSQARAELADTRSELERMRREPSRIDPAEFAEAQRKLAAAEADRERMAAELRRLKQREADLLKQRDDDVRRYTDERLQWLGEIRSLRQSLQGRPAEAAPAPPADSPPANQPEQRSFERVLDQFEAVKRNAALHRTRKNSPPDST